MKVWNTLKLKAGIINALTIPMDQMTIVKVPLSYMECFSTLSYPLCIVWAIPPALISVISRGYLLSNVCYLFSTKQQTGKVNNYLVIIVEHLAAKEFPSVVSGRLFSCTVYMYTYCIKSNTPQFV